jgi:hypothetical protein
MELELSPLEIDVLRGFIGELLATTTNEVLETIYTKLLEE